MVRVTPVSPRPITSPEGTPLDRSGLDARELLTTSDQIVVRSQTPAIELDMGLEQARGSMVRNNPAEALAILDEVWDGARHTETGWYLRASSLALLGLPAEAARVASDAVLKLPESRANLFVLALAKLSLGELHAARESIAQAMRQREPDALLLVQSALLEAQTGNAAEAEKLLRRASAEFPDHPALTYGRRMIREVLQPARDERFPLHVDGADFNRMRTPAFLRTPVSSIPVTDPYRESIDAQPLSNDVLQFEPPETVPNAVGDAVKRLGVALRNGTEHDAIFVAREMLASLSPGGAMANATTASRAHVLRSLLTIIVSTLKAPGRSGSVGWVAESIDGQWQRATADNTVVDTAREFGAESNGRVAETARQMVSLLRDKRCADAELLLARASGSLDHVTVGILRSLATDRDDSPNARRANGAASQADDGEHRVQYGDSSPSLLAPIRLGLALLPATDLLNHALRPLGLEFDRNNRGAHFAPASIFADNKRGDTAANGATLLVIAAALFALGVLAFAFGRPLLGLGLSGAGGWVAMRSFAGRENDSRV